MPTFIECLYYMIYSYIITIIISSLYANSEPYWTSASLALLLNQGIVMNSAPRSAWPAPCALRRLRTQYVRTRGEGLQEVKGRFLLWRCFQNVMPQGGFSMWAIDNDNRPRS